MLRRVVNDHLEVVGRPCPLDGHYRGKVGGAVRNVRGSPGTGCRQLGEDFHKLVIRHRLDKRRMELRLVDLRREFLAFAVEASQHPSELLTHRCLQECVQIARDW